LRLLVLAAYLAGLLTMALRAELRRSRLAAIVFAQTGLTLIILLFFEGAKQPWFLIHLVWLFAVALAVSLTALWDHAVRWRPILAIGALGFICIELGYPALLVAQNRYRNNYVPLVAMLRDRATEPRSVMGTAELGFGLGFEKVLDDSRLGYYTRKEPAFIVFDPRYRAILEQFRRERPEIYDYIQALLSRRYHQLYSNGYYTAWAHNSF